MITTPYMGLAVWNSVTDTWNHEQLADNFRRLDDHDHASGKGRQIPTGGIEDGAITKSKLAPDTLAIEDGSIDTRHLRDLAVTTPKLAFNAVTEEKIMPEAVGTRSIRTSNIYKRHFNPALRKSLGLDYRSARSFTPNGVTKVGEFAQPPRANGESNMLKVSIPGGGALLYMYAEGSLTANPASSPFNSDYLDIRAFIELSYADVNVLVPLFLGRVERLNKVKNVRWFSYPGAEWGTAQSYRQYDGDQHTLLTNSFEFAAPGQTKNAQSNAGGPIAKYISSPSNNDLTAVAKLTLKVGPRWEKNPNTGGRPNSAKPTVKFNAQTMALWSVAVSDAGA